MTLAMFLTLMAYATPAPRVPKAFVQPQGHGQKAVQRSPSIPGAALRLNHHSFSSGGISLFRKDDGCDGQRDEPYMSTCWWVGAVVRETIRKKINLALQGGGAYGAFTWGVLDHILQDGRLDIEGVTGASSGAINAIMLTDGLARGGPNEARKRLADFLRATSIDGKLPALQRKVIDELFWPTKIWLDATSRYLSPYGFSPLNLNPLKELVERFVDFEVVRRCQSPQLFVSATNVETGRLRIFSHDKVTAEAIAASACLPNLFRAVEIDGVPYWDGAYLGNPSIFPLFQTTTTEDVLLVQLNPLQRRGTPTSSVQILSRLNEITLNSPLMGELRAIEFVRWLIDQGRLQRGVGPGKY